MTTHPSADALDRLLAAAAELRDYPFPERREAWRARLAVNQPELARFAALDTEMANPAEVATRQAVTPSPVPPPPGLPAGRLPSGYTAREALARAKVQADLKCFITLDESAAADSGAKNGLLAGVPIAVKDLMAIRGLPLTGGSRALSGAVASEDAPAIARLRTQGAVVVGTANLHELAYGITNDNPHFGTARNPRDPERIPGGSSGGSAAAVAAGIVPIAVGTDTAGSIRIPAACCGVVGIKPSYGLVPRDGVIALAESLDHVGPIGAGVTEVWAALSAMSGGADLPPAAPPTQAPRLVLPKNFFFELLESSVREALDKALDRLRAAGFTFVERTVDGLEDAAAVQFLTICPEATLANWEHLIGAPEGLGEDVRVRLEIGQFMAGIDYLRAQRYRQLLRSRLHQALEGATAILTPTLVTGAPKIGSATVAVDGAALPVHTAMTRCTAVFNLTGMPAITLPCGQDRDGLPVGLQLAGRIGEDTALLTAAAAVERTLANVT